MFVSTIVVGILILLISYRRKYVKVDKLNFIRDVVFLLFAFSNLLVIIIIGEINFWASIVFASTCIIYIGLVSYMHIISIKREGIINETCGQNSHYQDLRLPLQVHSADKVVPNKNQVIMLILHVVGLPFYSPRRLTIPIVTQEQWSKPIAVISVVLAPIMLALIFNTQQGNMGLESSLVIYCVAQVIGIALGTCTFTFTSSTMAPQKCVFLWYASGFLMSVMWTYITAEELVSLLQSLGTIIGLNPSILGLAILAWGNSLGDLTANVAMAMHDGPDGAQIAIAGCYVGPVFNIFVGLGFSFVIACWLDYPNPYIVPANPYLLETVGFLICGLL